MKKFLLVLLITCAYYSCTENYSGTVSSSGSGVVADRVAENNGVTDITRTFEKAAAEKFILIGKSNTIPGYVNTMAIGKLDTALKAVAAFYSALGGSDCTGETCDLTTALGLGKQGSAAHKALLKEYFPNDKAAQQQIAQDCYQRPSGASSFSDYAFLDLEKDGDTVIVNYSLMVYSQGDVTYISGPDKYVYNGKIYTTVNRNIWKDI